MEKIIFWIDFNGYNIIIIMLLVTIWTILVWFQFYTKWVKDSSRIIK